MFIEEIQSSLISPEHEGDPGLLWVSLGVLGSLYLGSRGGPRRPQLLSGGVAVGVDGVVGQGGGGAIRWGDVAEIRCWF